jgi:hypothetical protein
MLIKPLLLSAAHPGFAASRPALRRAAAAVLQAASQLLLRLASHLAAAPARPGAAVLVHVIEFHAEAGAPEGALYVDGQLVGHLPGVRRL